MNYFDLDKKKVTLGGIASGKIHIDEFGRISSTRLFGSVFSPIFTIKSAHQNGSEKAYVLNAVRDERLSFDAFNNTKAATAFPFYNLTFEDKDAPLKAELCAFTPFLVLNDTDSGIPAVFFEFTVQNISSERQDFSLCAVCPSPFDNPVSRMGCSEAGEAYICLSKEHNSLCISTDDKNISFCENIVSFNDFEKKFMHSETLENIPSCKNSYGCALSTHFSIDAGQKHKVRFVLSWFIPQKDGLRNYYTNYFESSSECCSYCFSHYDRLFGDSKQFCDLVFTATLPKRVLSEINNSLWEHSEEDFTRLSCGAPMIKQHYEKFSDMNSFINRPGITPALFPRFDYSEVSYLYKTCLDDDTEILFDGQKDLERQLLLILRSYRKYILSGNVDELIEEWYYIVKCFEYFCGEENKSRLDKNADGRISIVSLQELYSACIYAMADMANAVRDKKRYESYCKMYENVPMQEAIDYSFGFSKLFQYSGFCYDAVKKHIGFYPVSDECPLDFGGTFRCPFFTPDGYGYVEEGIDYIEINMIKGSLLLRSFGVPRVPRLVQYGGRNWRFENRDNVAFLDSELEVTQSKKLTILIDIKR